MSNSAETKGPQQPQDVLRPNFDAWVGLKVIEASNRLPAVRFLLLAGLGTLGWFVHVEEEVGPYAWASLLSMFVVGAWFAWVELHMKGAGTRAKAGRKSAKDPPEPRGFRRRAGSLGEIT